MPSSGGAVLSFEILDSICTYFSSKSGQWSYYESQQDLLSFCLVSREWNAIARLHLARFIPIATTLKAQQILGLCNDDRGINDDQDGSPSNSFGSRVQSLLLIWADQGAYRTRRNMAMTRQDLLDLLSSFPSLRELEITCLPFTKLDEQGGRDPESEAGPLGEAGGGGGTWSLQHGILASTGALHNLRSLTLTNVLSTLRRESFETIAVLLSLCPLLKSLNLYNIPLSFSTATDHTALTCPTFSLSSFSLQLTSPRELDVSTLEWMLQSTIDAKSLKRLTLHLSTKITDRNMYEHTTKPELGFVGLGGVLGKLAGNLASLSLCGTRIGHASEILSKTSARLKELELFDTFGLGPDLLNDLPGEARLEKLAFQLLPRKYGGIDLDVLDYPYLASWSYTAGSNSGHDARKNKPTTTASPAAGTAHPTGSARHVAITAVDGTTSTTDEPPSHALQYHPDVPIPSAAFTAELQPGGRLEHLKELVIPINARFQKRGKWLNNATLKACRKKSIKITEVGRPPGE